mmetsp:Transcript_25929/g.61526  ORF Transcript_25929/g.61526 Transcript_25929/m.61526 type:complete len:89 (-) Transcript_25929:2814-3080(-)
MMMIHHHHQVSQAPRFAPSNQSSTKMEPRRKGIEATCPTLYYAHNIKKQVKQRTSPTTTIATNSLQNEARPPSSVESTLRVRSRRHRR